MIQPAAKLLVLRRTRVGPVAGNGHRFRARVVAPICPGASDLRVSQLLRHVHPLHIVGRRRRCGILVLRARPCVDVEIVEARTVSRRDRVDHDRAIRFCEGRRPLLDRGKSDLQRDADLRERLCEQKPMLFYVFLRNAVAGIPALFRAERELVVHQAAEVLIGLLRNGHGIVEQLPEKALCIRPVVGVAHGKMPLEPLQQQILVLIGCIAHTLPRFLLMLPYILTAWRNSPTEKSGNSVSVK